MRVVDPPSRAEVIDIADAKVERLSVKVGRYEYDGCQHRRTWIDERLRIVECRDCEEKLDPMEVLIDIAHNWRSESLHGKRIREHERKEYDAETEREKRHVRLHVVCHGCGLQSRLTKGKLTDGDWASWEAHWGTSAARTETTLSGREWSVLAITHRRRTEKDVERHRSAVPGESDTEAWGTNIFVHAAPTPEHNEWIVPTS